MGLVYQVLTGLCRWAEHGDERDEHHRQPPSSSVLELSHPVLERCHFDGEAGVQPFGAVVERVESLLGEAEPVEQTADDGL